MTDKPDGLSEREKPEDRPALLDGLAECLDQIELVIADFPETRIASALFAVELARKKLTLLRRTFVEG